MPEKFIPQEALSPARVKPGSFTHSPDYIHILRRNHSAAEINMKGAAANPQHYLARVAPGAWEIKAPLVVEILPVNDLHPPPGAAPACFLWVLFSPLQMPACLVNRTESPDAALQDLPYESPAMISRVCLMGLSRDCDLSRSARLKGNAFTGCLHTRTGCCRQLAARMTNIQGPSTQYMSLTRGNTWRRYAAQDIRSVVCALRFLTQKQCQACRMPAGARMHTPADFGSSLASWGPRALPYVLASETTSGLNIHRVFFSLPSELCKDLFVQVSPSEGTQGHRLKGWHCTHSLLLQSHRTSLPERATYTDDFHLSAPSVFLLPLMNLHRCQLSQPTTQFSRHNQSPSPLICLAAVPGMQARAAGPEGAGGLPACRNLPQKRSARRHMSLVAASVAALLQHASPSSQDLSSQRHLPIPRPTWDYLLHQEMKYL